MEYKAYYVEESDGVFLSSIQNLDIPEPQDGELLISVSFSSLNYKDALCATGVKGVAASYPFVPGIDAVGTVTKSNSCLLYTSPSPRDGRISRMPSSA